MGTPPLSSTSSVHHAVQEVKSDLRELAAEIREFRKADIEAHTSLEKHMNTIATRQSTMTAVTEERVKSDSSLRKQVFALVFLFLTTAAGMVGWAVAEFRALHASVEEHTDELAREIKANSIHFSTFEARGRKWGEGLDAKDKEHDEQLRELRHRIDQKHGQGR